jgi:hypothetical protein
MLTQEDFNKIEKANSKQKKVDGMVYSTIEKANNFHLLKDVPIGGVALGEIIANIFKTQEDTNQKLMDKIETLKDILLNYEERISTMEAKLTKFGLD